MPQAGKIRVLVVDDSAIVRKILSETIEHESDMEVAGVAPDPYIARDKMLELKPDVITLDIEMPRMDGLTFLGKIMQFQPTPVIVISSLAQSSCESAMRALQLGAVEVLAKPGGPYSVGELRIGLPAAIRAAARVRLENHSIPHPAPVKPVAQRVTQPASPRLPQGTVIAIGASTGGTEAVARVLAELAEDIPAILIAQHIPPGFSRAFAERLNRTCRFEVKEAEDGDEVRPGRALVAPGNLHMVLESRGGRYVAAVRDGPRVCYQRPSVDVLFSSVAQTAGKRALGILLTGMGSDGAQGLLKMRSAGAFTVAQNEASCVVFGMPREAIRLGAAEEVLPLGQIAGAICRGRPAALSA